MGGSYYIQMINVALATTLLAGFAGFWLYDKSRKAPLLFFFATLFFLGGGCMELIAPKVATADASLFRFTLYTVNLMAGVLLSCGVVLHYKLKPYWAVTGLCFLAGLALTYAVLDMPRQSVLRVALNQLPLVMAIAIGAVRAGLVRNKFLVDRLLVIALSVFALNLALRPAVLALYGTMGADPAQFHKTQYALITQFSLVITTMITATILMLALIVDIVRDLAYQSRRDALTGLHNRRSFDKEFDGFLEKAKRGSLPLCMMVCDLDHFKGVNDTYGHATGDKVIQAFGELLGSSNRETDICARTGGEEFCIALWNCTHESAKLLGEAVRTSFHAMSIEGLPEGKKLSASFGIAQWKPGDNQQDLLQRADEALYQAKKNGRNRVVVAPCDADIQQVA